MDRKHLEALIEVERGYWWHVAKRELVAELLRRHFPAPGRLVEGGVGGGANLRMCRDLGYDVSGFDLMPEAVAHCRELGINDVRTHDLRAPWPVERGPVDVVVLLDVIEHVPDPVLVLRNAAETLGPDGEIVVTVPAIPALMGPWDRMLGHHRRYSAHRLLREHAGARRGSAGRLAVALERVHAAGGTRRPDVRKTRPAARRSAEFPAVSPRVNSLLIALARGERRLIVAVRLMLGLSLVGVLKR